MNTPASIIPNPKDIEQTESPWIYSELAMSKLIRVKYPEQHRADTTKMMSESMILEKALKIDYTVDLSHLTPLDKAALDVWGTKTYSSATEALDALYKLKS